MRKLIAWVVLLCGFMPVLWAADGCDQHLSREEFRAKQKAFIIEQAGLSKEEAAKFFSVYFELQDKKKKLNDESWDLMRKGKDDKTTEAQYKEINEKIVEMLRPEGMTTPIQLVFQSIEGLREAIPNHKGDWYFTGHYPTPGGTKLCNQSFVNYIENVYHK